MTPRPGFRHPQVPTGGFGRVIGCNQVGPADASECILGITAGGAIEVDRLVERAIQAGASVVTEPAQQPWGYSGTFAHPDGHLWMVTATEPGEAASTKAHLTGKAGAPGYQRETAMTGGSIEN